MEFKPLKLRCVQYRQFLYGFTLVELLVVIAIIALLLSILMPALNKVREQARSVVCKTNLGNIGKAEMVYAAENNNSLVFTRYDEMQGGSQVDVHYWAAQLWATYNGMKSIPSASITSAPKVVKRPAWLLCPSLIKISDGKAAFARLNGTTGILVSWADVRLSNNSFWLQNISYARNSVDQGYHQIGYPQSEHPAGKLSNFKSPSSVAANADSFYMDFFAPDNYRPRTDKYDKFHRLSPQFDTTDGRQVEYRHDKGQGLNLLLWDGHVDSVRNSIVDKYRTDPTK